MSDYAALMTEKEAQLAVQADNAALCMEQAKNLIAEAAESIAVALNVPWHSVHLSVDESGEPTLTIRNTSIQSAVLPTGMEALFEWMKGQYQ